VTGHRRAREDLLAVIQQMTDAQVGQLRNIAAAMMRPVDEQLLPGSDVAGQRFAEEFRARLQAHHGTHATAMDRLSFENALMTSLASEGHTVEPAPGATTRFWDVRVDGSPVSVKSTAAKGLRHDLIHIPKLCEAAWIRDCRSASARQQKTVELFTDFLAVVRRWFLLRAFTLPDGFRYELVEIPVSAFRSILTLPKDTFNSDAPRIDVPDSDGVRLFQLRLDRSDAKVTIALLRRDICAIHGEWYLHTR
jgi:Type II site-specific deoxyribonuclease